VTGCSGNKVRKRRSSGEPARRCNGARESWTVVWGTGVPVVRSVMQKADWRSARCGSRSVCQVSMVSGREACEVAVTERVGGAGLE